jgi:hypothetical protein
MLMSDDKKTRQCKTWIEMFCFHCFNFILRLRTQYDEIIIISQFYQTG